MSVCAHDTSAMRAVIIRFKVRFIRQLFLFVDADEPVILGSKSNLLGVINGVSTVLLCNAVE